MRLRSASYLQTYTKPQQLSACRGVASYKTCSKLACPLPVCMLMHNAGMCACSALEKLQPRVVSFEDSATKIREDLALALETEEQFAKAAHILAGIDLDSGEFRSPLPRFICLSQGRKGPRVTCPRCKGALGLLYAQAPRSYPRLSFAGSCFIILRRHTQPRSRLQAQAKHQDCDAVS